MSDQGNNHKAGQGSAEAEVTGPVVEMIGNPVGVPVATFGDLLDGGQVSLFFNWPNGVNPAHYLEHIADLCDDIKDDLVDIAVTTSANPARPQDTKEFQQKKLEWEGEVDKALVLLRPLPYDVAVYSLMRLTGFVLGRVELAANGLANYYENAEAMNAATGESPLQVPKGDVSH